MDNVRLCDPRYQHVLIPVLFSKKNPHDIDLTTRGLPAHLLQYVYLHQYYINQMLNNVSWKVERRFQDNQKVWKKDPVTGTWGQELFFIMEGIYDADRSGWDYKVRSPTSTQYMRPILIPGPNQIRNSDGIEYAGLVQQKDLTKA